MNESRRSSSMIAATICGSILSCAIPASAEELKLASFTPAVAPPVRLGLATFAREFDHRTDGRFQFEIVADGTLLGPRDTLMGIGEGKAHGGFVVPSFAVDALPHVNLIPGLLSFAKDAKQATGAAIETLLLDCAECQRDYSNSNAVYLGGSAAGPYWLQCAHTLENPADLRD